MDKKKTTLFLLGTIVFLGMVHLLITETEGKITSNVFVGSIKEINGNNILINGAFVVKGDLSYASKLFEVIVVVEPETVITRAKIKLPEFDEDNQAIDGTKLVRTFDTVDLKTLTDDANFADGLGLEVKSERNILGRARFTATEIDYAITDLGWISD